MMELGVCYYPEHWPEDTWKTDAERMKDIGLSWVRIGEFAWSRLESKDGQLHFDWLERSLDTLGSAGLKVVLGTPTATPPKWLCDKYPDMYQVDINGNNRNFGSRRHYSYNSKPYFQESQRIVTAMAEYFSKHEALEAWQTDNEFGCHDTIRSYGQQDKIAFQAWLKDKYKTVDNLNNAWWNVFWSMEYTNFSEVDLPNLTTTEANPSHTLDFYRFSSDAMIAYSKMQCDTIRQYSDKPITHNVMLFFESFDHFKFAQDVDVITWDSYPLGMLEMSPHDNETKNKYFRTGHPDMVSFMHDLYFGLKEKPFWVMEQQPGQVNWAPSNPLPEKGMVKVWSHQAFAHGADVVAYFRWRAAVGAQETNHAGLNKHDGTPDTATHEAKQVASDLANHPSITTSQKQPAKIALLFDYEQMWATDIQPHAEGWNYWRLQMSYYSALRTLGLDVDIRHPNQALDGYKLVLAPALHMVDAELSNKLISYCNQGGHLIVGPRSGSKTMTNIIHAPMLAEWLTLTGLRLTHVDGIRPTVTESFELEGTTSSYHTWADVFENVDADVIGTYTTKAYANAPAVAEKTHGTGKCITLGMWADDSFHVQFFAQVAQTLGFEIHHLEGGLRLTTRGNHQYLINFDQAEGELKGKTVKPYDIEII